jgi:hopanoid biosynthesis associated protein HpnK
VNRAIEAAHRSGILTAASLMVGAPAAADAVERARRLPSLRVGLHLVLARGRPVLPKRYIPALLDRDGELEGNLLKAGLRFWFLAPVRQQLEAEIRAQFEAFRDTGLPLDHLNGHNHIHLHPTVLDIVLRLGPRYGLKAVRLPNEPVLASWRAAKRGLPQRAALALLLRPLLHAARRRIEGAGLRCNDFVFGLNDSGRMTADLVLALLGDLPSGVTEIYFHPATDDVGPGDARAVGYRYVEEFRALTDPAVAERLRGSGIRLLAFGDLDSA